MEFAFDVRGVLPDVVTRITGGQLSHLGKGLHEERSQQIATIVNKLGAASAKAQGLRVAVTTYQKLKASSHTLYVLRDNDGDRPAVIGILKVGRKKLFLSDLHGVPREVEPLCVLDFFVHESRQRTGHGKRLFHTMLDLEGVRASELAIDRPSIKFLSFLKKHYKLHSDVKQGNNFVVFSQFFQSKISHHGNKSLNPSQPYTSPVEQTVKTSLRSPPSTCTTEDSHYLTSTPGTQPPSNANFNWSPDVVLLRNQRTQCTPCNIITGAPLFRSNWKLPQTRKSDKAPFLTMRARDRPLKGASRLGFGLSSTPVDGYHLGDNPRTDSRYSRHSHCSIPSHASILPGQKSQNLSLEPRPDRWK